MCSENENGTHLLLNRKLLFSYDSMKQWMKLDVVAAAVSMLDWEIKINESSKHRPNITVRTDDTQRCFIYTTVYVAKLNISNRVMAKLSIYYV